MRMRKKKNLAEKMESVSDILAVLHSDDPNYVTSALKKEYIDFKGIFGNDNPMQIEIGCGKGQFVCELAKRNPDINYIAVEVKIVFLFGKSVPGVLALNRCVENENVNITCFFVKLVDAFRL